MTTKMFGRPITRVEDARLVRGEGLYLDDLAHGALACAFVRSPHAHARVTDIDVTDALDIDGLVAIYTLNEPTKEVQNVAYSLDNGTTYKEFTNNPVLDFQNPNFRDPKVFWYAPGSQWIMAVALPRAHQVLFYGSKNLKRWKFLSAFGPAGIDGYQYECPNLFQVPVQGTNDMKWILVVAINPGERLEYAVNVSTRDLVAGETYTVEAFFPNFEPLRQSLPVTPVNLEAPRMLLSDAINLALESRFELAELRTNKEINDINKRFYRDQKKPQVDLAVSYSSNDGPAWSTLLGEDNPRMRVGVRISLPLKNRTAKAEYGESLAEGRRIDSVRAQAEQQIEAEVRNAIQRLR